MFQKIGVERNLKQNRMLKTLKSKRKKNTERVRERERERERESEWNGERN